MPWLGRRFRRRLATGLAVLAVSLGAAVPAHAKTVLDGFARESLDHHIRPSYAAFETRIKGLGSSIRALCDNDATDGERLADVRDAFREAVLAWSRVEHLRFGPAVEENRYERVAFWPDAKGLGRRQVQRALRSHDASVTDVENLADKSVALQGLTALEIVLHGDTISATTADGNRTASALHRCAYATAISDNLANIADEIVVAWGPDGAFTAIWLNAGPDNAVYLDASEIVLELVRAYEFCLETARDLKMMRPMGLVRPRRRPTLPPYFISELSIPVLRANIQGIRHLLLHGGLLRLMGTESPSFAQGILSELNQSIRVLGEMDAAGRDAFSLRPDRDRLVGIGFPLKRARIAGAGELKRVAGLSIGFNASDGD